MTNTHPSEKIAVPILKRIKNALLYGKEDSIKCQQCKEALELRAKNLYLIPCFFSEKHDQTVEYYKKNAVLITDTEYIPSGQRATFMQLYTCPNCGGGKVSIIDFLKVRDQSMLKDGIEATYEEMGDFVAQGFIEAKKHLPADFNPENPAYSYIDRLTC